MTKDSMWAKHHMRENRNNQFRPEQQDYCRDLREQFPEYTVLMEYFIPFTKESGEKSGALVDICIVELGICYRINGGIHKSKKQEERDWEQKIYLENMLYHVVDVDDD